MNPFDEEESRIPGAACLELSRDILRDVFGSVVQRFPHFSWDAATEEYNPFQYKEKEESPLDVREMSWEEISRRSQYEKDKPLYRRFSRGLSIKEDVKKEESGAAFVHFLEEFHPKPIVEQTSNYNHSEELKSIEKKYPQGFKPVGNPSKNQASNDSRSRLGKVCEEKRTNSEVINGKRIIVAFISLNWKLTERIRYTIDYMCCVKLPDKTRYKYCTCWSNAHMSSFVYFNIDSMEGESGKRRIRMTYSMPNSIDTYTQPNHMRDGEAGDENASSAGTNNGDYAREEYWNERFQKESSYEWLSGFEGFREQLLTKIRKEDRILHIGCGSSSLSMELYKLGFTEITNVDFSDEFHVLIESRQKSHPEMEWICDDIRLLMKIPSASFDVVLEKATIEALMVAEKSAWTPSATALVTLDTVWAAIGRVLCPETGRYLSLSFTQPHFRVPALMRFSGWAVDVQKFGEGIEYFLYTCELGKDTSTMIKSKYTSIAPDWLR